VKTAIGNLPAPGALDLRGLDLPEADLRALLTVDLEGWQEEAAGLSSYFGEFGDRLPAALRSQLGALQERLGLSASKEG
jgi:phosphoenolpyruvate carboxykinase (GTP)